VPTTAKLRLVSSLLLLVGFVALVIGLPFLFPGAAYSQEAWWHGAPDPGAAHYKRELVLQLMLLAALVIGCRRMLPRLGYDTFFWRLLTLSMLGAAAVVCLLIYFCLTFSLGPPDQQGFMG
jgi:hypothetical protein